MKQKTVEVKLKQGLEARPAAMLVQVASKHASNIYLESEGRKVNAKSIMGMMSLALAPGEKVTVMQTERMKTDAISEWKLFKQRGRIKKTKGCPPESGCPFSIFQSKLVVIEASTLYGSAGAKQG